LLGNILEIKRKPKYKWHPQKWHCRKVSIPECVADEIRQRQKEWPGTNLIFPNERGKPNKHLLRRLQRLTKGTTLFTELHKLRKTWATRMNKKFPISELQTILGHKKLETSMKY